jgi:hypothetical protein
MGGVFSSPKQPEIPKMEEVVNPDEAAKKALAEEKAKAMKRKGRLSTILTQQTPGGTLLGG